MAVTDLEASRHSVPMTALHTDASKLSFEALYDTHVGEVWRAVRRLGVAASAVDDVVQETFVTAWRSLARFEGRSSLKTWLVGIAFNHARHALRAQGLRSGETPVESVTLPSGASTPEELVQKQRRGELLLVMLSRLPEEQRTTFVLVELEGLSAVEVAALVQVPLNTIYSRLRLARSAINDAVARLKEPA